MLPSRRPRPFRREGGEALLFHAAVNLNSLCSALFGLLREVSLLSVHSSRLRWPPREKEGEGKAKRGKKVINWAVTRDFLPLGLDRLERGKRHEDPIKSPPKRKKPDRVSLSFCFYSVCFSLWTPYKRASSLLLPNPPLAEARITGRRNCQIFFWAYLPENRTQK